MGVTPEGTSENVNGDQNKNTHTLNVVFCYAYSVALNRFMRLFVPSGKEYVKNTEWK